MRSFLLLSIVILAAQTTYADQLLRLKTEPAALYSTEMGKSSKGDLLKEDKLVLIRQGKNRTFIKTLGGLRGWVDNTRLEKVRIWEGYHYELDEIAVKGWLNNPHALYIFDQKEGESVAIYLSRNFKEELVEFVDRETLETAHLENISYPLPGFYSPLPKKIL